MHSREHPLKFWNTILLGIASGLIVFMVFIMGMIGTYHHVYGNLAEREWAVAMAINTLKWGGIGLFAAEGVLLLIAALATAWRKVRRR